MLNSTMRNGMVAAMLTAAMLAMPAQCNAGRILDCLFGTSAPAQTTYAPAYVTPVAPPCVTSGCPTTTCPPVMAPSCGPCVPQTCNYTPTVAYYQPMPVTTYRPFFSVGYRAPLVPYATYRMAYAPVVPYVAYSPYASCASPCSSCASPCGAGGCGAASYGGYSGGCSSCAATSTSNAAPYAGSESPTPAPAQKTFQENKPIAEPEAKPEPKPAEQPGPKLTPIPEATPSSTPAPRLIDPSDRTAALPVRQAARVELVGLPVQNQPQRENIGWRASRD